MECVEKNLNSIDLGIIFYDEYGKIEFINNYVKKYLTLKDVDLFFIFPEIKDKLPNNNFKTLTNYIRTSYFFFFQKVS